MIIIIIIIIIYFLYNVDDDKNNINNYHYHYHYNYNAVIPPAPRPPRLPTSCPVTWAHKLQRPVLTERNSKILQRIHGSRNFLVPSLDSGSC